MQECASLLGVSVCTVRRWVKSGRLAATQIVGKNGPEHRITLGSMRTVSEYPTQSRTVRPTQPAAAQGEQVAIAALVQQLEHLRAVNAQLAATNATLAAALAASERRQRPWQATSPEPVCPNGSQPRRWWWPWRRG